MHNLHVHILFGVVLFIISLYCLRSNLSRYNRIFPIRRLIVRIKINFAPHFHFYAKGVGNSININCRSFYFVCRVIHRRDEEKTTNVCTQNNTQLNKHMWWWRWQRWLWRKKVLRYRSENKLWIRLSYLFLWRICVLLWAHENIMWKRECRTSRQH